MARNNSWQKVTRLRETQTEVIKGLESIGNLQDGQKIMTQFLDVLVERWRKNLVKYNIGHEGDLDASFTKRATASDGVIKGRANFEYYGRFVDLGVGKGVKLSEAGGRLALTSSRPGARRRRPKKWFSGTWAYERRRLAEVYQKYVSEELLDHMEAFLEGGIKINI